MVTVALLTAATATSLESTLLESTLRPLGSASPSTRAAFLAIVGAVACERLFEVWLSRRNARRVLARGGVEVGRGHYPLMVALHTAFLLAAVAEVLFLPTRPVGWLTALSVLVVAASMSLRYWAILALGDRWNTRVLVEPGRDPVKRGPYRFLRHPNYLAVIAEIAFLPLIHGAWRTALAFSLANLALLRHRVAVEEAAVYGAAEDRPVSDHG